MSYIENDLSVQQITMFKKSCNAFPTIVQPLHDYREGIARLSCSRSTTIVQSFHDYINLFF